MSDGAPNGQARFDDLRASVVGHIERVTSLEVDHARLSSRLEAVERSLERLIQTIERMREEDSPRGQRERALAGAQVATVIIMVISMVVPYLRH